MSKTLERVIKLVERFLDLNNCTIKEDCLLVYDLGADSLMLMEMYMLAEDVFPGTDFMTEKAEQIKSVKDMADFISESQNNEVSEAEFLQHFEKAFSLYDSRHKVHIGAIITTSGLFKEAALCPII
jgi:acyl carrier protein